MKTLVTGGAGCIGSELAETLMNRGAEVVILDNLTSGRREHVQALLDRPGFRLVEGDILEPEVLERVMPGVDEVWHLAANPDVRYEPDQPTDKDLKQNVLGTYNVLESMRRNGVRRLLFTSTSAVYGMSDHRPLSEVVPPNPISLYGASKLACEAMIGAYQHLFGMRCLIFRLANIVGAKTRKTGATVISDFVRKLRENPSRLEILGNGKQKKSYLFVSECVEAMLFANDRVIEPLAVYNVGCSDSLTVTAIAGMVVDILGLKDVEFDYTGTEGGWAGDVPRFLLDTGKLNKLGWKAQLSSEQAVRRAAEQIIAASASGSPVCRP